MKPLLEIKIDNIFKDKEYTNNRTGETKAQKWKIQTYVERETEHGKKMELSNVSITDEQYEALKDKVGKTVTIPVGVYVNDKTLKYGFYGVN